MKALALLPLALAACAPVPSPVAAERECNPAAAVGLVGRSFTDILSIDAKTRAGAGVVRMIRPGMAVTMDYRSDRLNIDLDERGMVTRFRCG